MHGKTRLDNNKVKDHFASTQIKQQLVGTQSTPRCYCTHLQTSSKETAISWGTWLRVVASHRALSTQVWCSGVILKLRWCSTDRRCGHAATAKWSYVLHSAVPSTREHQPHPWWVLSVLRTHEKEGFPMSTLAAPEDAQLCKWLLYLCMSASAVLYHSAFVTNSSDKTLLKSRIRILRKSTVEEALKNWQFLEFAMQ